MANGGVSATVDAMDDEFQGIDRRVVALWRWHSLFSTLIVIVVMIIGSLIAVNAGDVGNWVWLLVAGFAIFSTIFGTLWHPLAAFKRWRFRVTPKIIRLHSGVIFQQEVHVPMDRVQHVDLERGPLERKLGLARVILFTAGTKAAQQEIPGLDHSEAIRLRDQIAKDLEAVRRES